MRISQRPPTARVNIRSPFSVVGRRRSSQLQQPLSINQIAGSFCCRVYLMRISLLNRIRDSGAAHAKYHLRFSFVHVRVFVTSVAELRLICLLFTEHQL